MKNKIQLKLGYQAPKPRRINYKFMTASVRDFHYCYSHDFWYSPEEQDRLLHYGQPCYYTDGYMDSPSNSYRQGDLPWRRRGKKGYSLKGLIRIFKKTRNLPVGTIVDFQHNYYLAGRKSGFGCSLGYKFKVKKENHFNPDYQVLRPDFFANFINDKKCEELVNILRSNGFLVKVSWAVDHLYKVNEDGQYIYDTDGSAIKEVPEEQRHQYAIAYGHGLRVGFSEKKFPLHGYSYGVPDVLFDYWDEFNKWSQTVGISKEESNEEILKTLLNAEQKKLLKEAEAEAEAVTK